MSLNHRLLLVGSCFTLLVACSHNPPPELVDARVAFDRASEGPAKKYTPAELHLAETSLALAEDTFADENNTLLVRNQAYIAMRKAELAESMARTIKYERGLTASELREELLEDQDASRTKTDLAAAEDASAETSRELAAAKTAGAQTEKELAAEKLARASAEKRAAQSAADLARIAAVKQDERGLIITLSGGVLFASAKSVLLPAAQVKLNEVAEALLAGDPAATFVVEGHTDSQGKTDANQTLSLSRANAVRDYLILHDIAADRITAEGHGEDHGIADNDSAEGRANNRRVEIVVRPAKG